MPIYNDVMVPAMAGGDPLTANPESGVPIMPGPVDSFVLGALTVRHDRGLRSGGLFGYSTFFTGTGTNASMARKASVGHLGLQMIRGAAHAASGLGVVQTNRTASLVANALKGIHQTGVAGAYAQIKMGRAGLIDAPLGPRDALFHNDALRPRDARFHDAPLGPRDARFHNGPRVVKGADDAAAAVRAGGAEAAGFVDDLAKKDWFMRLIGGVFGGVDMDAADALQVKGGRVLLNTGQAMSGSRWGNAVRRATGRAELPLTTGGQVVLKGGLGRFAGAAIKGIGVLEGLKIASDVAVWGVGRGYGALSRVTNEIQARHNPRALSAAYFNDATTTERRRAVAELNSSVLLPRNQLMGNEGSMYHR